MNQMISLGDLITIVLFILGSALLVFLILAVSNLLKVLRNVNEILEKNKSNIEKSIGHLPAITENAAKITDMAKDDLTKLQHVFDDAGKISGTIKSGVETVQKDIILKIKSILDIVDSIRKLIEKRKENNKNKKKNTVYKYTYKPGQAEPEEVTILSPADAGDKPHEGYVKVDPDGGDCGDTADGETPAVNDTENDKPSE